jgi:hypothetical protein
MGVTDIMLGKAGFVAVVSTLGRVPAWDLGDPGSIPGEDILSVCPPNCTKIVFSSCTTRPNPTYCQSHP